MASSSQQQQQQQDAMLLSKEEMRVNACERALQQAALVVGQVLAERDSSVRQLADAELTAAAALGRLEEATQAVQLALAHEYDALAQREHVRNQMFNNDNDNNEKNKSKLEIDALAAAFSAHSAQFGALGEKAVAARVRQLDARDEHNKAEACVRLVRQRLAYLNERLTCVELEHDQASAALDAANKAHNQSAAATAAAAGTKNNVVGILRTFSSHKLSSSSSSSSIADETMRCGRCTAATTLATFAAHKHDECNERLVRCPYCAAQVAADEWTRHTPQCARTPDHVRIGASDCAACGQALSEQTELRVLSCGHLACRVCVTRPDARRRHVVCEACGDRDRSSHRLKIRTQ